MKGKGRRAFIAVLVFLLMFVGCNAVTETVMEPEIDISGVTHDMNENATTSEEIILSKYLDLKGEWAYYKFKSNAYESESEGLEDVLCLGQLKDTMYFVDTSVESSKDSHRIALISYNVETMEMENYNYVKMNDGENYIKGSCSYDDENSNYIVLIVTNQRLLTYNKKLLFLSEISDLDMDGLADDKEIFQSDQVGAYEFIEGESLTFTSLAGESSSLILNEEGLVLQVLGDFYRETGELHAFVAYKRVNGEWGHLLWKVSGDNEKLRITVEGYKEKSDQELGLLNIIEYESPIAKGYASGWTVKDDKMTVTLVDYNNTRIAIGELDMISGQQSWISKDYEEPEEDVYYFSEDVYAYTTDDYKLIYHNHGDENVVYEGYYQDGTGGSGYYYSIPGGVRFSPDGEKFAYYLYGYEYSEGPYICDSKGDLFYAPGEYYTEFSGGEWLDDDHYLVSYLRYKDYDMGVLDFEEKMFTAYGSTGNTYYINDIDNRLVYHNSYNAFKRETMFYYIQDETKDNVFNGIELQAVPSGNGGKDSSQFFHIHDGKLYHFKYEDGDIVLREYDYQVDSQVKVDLIKEPIFFTDDYKLLNDEYRIYLKANRGLLEYYFLSVYGGYIKIAEYSKEELFGKIPEVVNWYDSQVMLFDQRMIVDKESGKQVEYDRLVEAVGNDVFEIVSAYAVGSDIGYMIRDDQEGIMVYSVYFKTLEEDGFKLCERFKVEEEKETYPLTLMLTGKGEMYYDYYNSETETIDIHQYTKGLAGTYLENCKNLRLDFAGEIGSYYDIGKEKYVNLKRDTVESSDPNPSIRLHGGSISYTKAQDDTTQLTIEIEQYRKPNLKMDVNIGDDLLIEAAIYYNVCRMRLIHWVSESEIEIVVREVELEE